MSHKNQSAPMTEREWRRRYVRMLQVEVGLLDPPDASGRTTKPTPKSAAARMRVVEMLCAEEGMPPPKWTRSSRAGAETIDSAPWAAARAASLRSQYERLGRYGLAFARDGTIRCVKCAEVVLAVPRGRSFAIGTTGSALAARHQATGCR
jgi:hypothetical protein